jgi:hypothetical protein
MINNQDFCYFLSTFTQTGKYCYGNILKHEVIRIPENVTIDRYLLNQVDTNFVSGQTYRNYPAYLSTVNTASFTDNQDGTWEVKILNYTE